MSKRFSFILLILIFVVVMSLFYSVAHEASRGGESRPLYSSYRYDPYGTAALREFFEGSDRHVTVLERPHLDSSKKGVLVQVLSVSADKKTLMSGYRYGLKVNELQRWIADGNTVIQFTRGITPLMKQLGIESQHFPAEEAHDIQKHQSKGGFPAKLPGKSVFAEMSGDSFGRGGRGLMLRSPGTFTCKDGNRWRQLSVVRTGTVVGEYLCGKGRLFVVGAPTPVLNSSIANAGNLDFVLSVVGDKNVIVDEWSHGIGHAGTLMQLVLKAGLTPLIFQIVFVLLLYIWSARGQQADDSDEVVRKRSGREQIKVLGYLYSRILSKSDVSAKVRSEIMRRLSEALRCPVEEIENNKIKLKPDEEEKIRNIKKILDEMGQTERKSRLESLHVMALTLSYEFVKEKRHG